MMFPIHPTRRSCMAIVCLALVAGQAFYSLQIAPLREQERAARRAGEALQGKIAEASGVVHEVHRLGEQASRAYTNLTALHAHQPSGSIHLWFPAQMKKHFSTLGIEAVTRLNTTAKEPGQPDFERTYWAVELPVGNSTADVRAACLAIAEIEPLDPAVRVLDTVIRPVAGDPIRRAAVINVSVLSRKAVAFR
jgi:hypothetical protein